MENSNDEAALVARARQDPEAFGLLYQHYLERMYRYLFSHVGEATEAEDLTAQVFVAAWEGLGRYQEKGVFAAWLFRIARNKVSDYHRQRRAHLSWESRGVRALTLQDGSRDPGTGLEHTEDLERLASLVQRLEPHRVELLRLRFAADLTYAEMASLLGRSDLLPGLPAALSAVGDYVYAAIPDTGLLVFDLSDPARLLEVYSLEFPFAPQALVLDGDRLLVAGGSCQGAACSGGLALVDISDPARPRLSAALQTAAPALRLELAEEIAYLYERACPSGRCTYSLRLVDVSSPAVPAELAALEVPGPLANMVIAGDRLLLGHERGLLVFDVSRPDRPTQTGRLGFSYLTSFALSGQYAYATSAGYYVNVIDLTDPDRPVAVNTTSVGQGMFGSPYYAAVHGRTLYVLDSFGEFGHCWSHLNVFDLLDPAAPHQVNIEQDTLGFSCAGPPAIQGNWMVVADWRGVYFADLSDPLRPRLHGSHPFAGTFEDLAVQDGYLYASNGLASASLFVLDTSPQAEPVLHGPFPFAWGGGLVARGRYLYLPSWEAGLVVADIADPTAPSQVAVLDPTAQGGAAFGAALDGDHLVLALGEAGIRIVDVSDPERPLPLGSLNLGGGGSYVSIQRLAARQGYVYLAANLPQGLEWAPRLVVVDARNPLNPLQVSLLDLPAGYVPFDLRVNEGLLFLAASRCPEENRLDASCAGHFSIYDLSDPREPVEIASLQFPFALNAVAAADGYAYLSGAPDRLLVLDLTVPASPALAGLFQAPGCAGKLAAEGQRFYLAACQAGLLVLEVEK